MTSVMDARVMRAIYPIPYKEIVRTGKKKFQKVASFIALVADPKNRVLLSIHPHSANTGDIPNFDDASTAIKITPETYSGVAVVAIEKVESDRSSRVPSRMPARTPTIKAEGTIRSRTKNISLPVKPNRLITVGPTSSLKTVE